MSKNLSTPTKLTEFAPLKTEEKSQTVGEFISRFFKLGNPFAVEDQGTLPKDASSQDLPSWVDTTETLCNDVPYNVDVNEGRSLPNVLKRISNLLALKSNNLQNYGDTELKQYWMPDSVSKQCYECLEKFTTFRRRHHCRVCGQIFCSTCCNQQIPGKIFGCTGDLRVCTYCCKIVLSYLSSDIRTDLTTDLKVLQENLRMKLCVASPLSPISQDNPSQNLKFESLEGPRKSLVEGYQEEMFASGVSSSSSALSNEEKCRAYQNSSSLRNLFEELSKPLSGVNLGTHRYHLRTYFDCFLGSELVDWLIYQQKANSRIQANALCQALLEGNYIECLCETSSFVDSYILYKLGNVASPDSPPPSNIYDIPTQEEPMWVQQVIQESNNVDSDSDQVLLTNRSFMQSSSSYMLDLNVEANTVYLSRPPPSSQNLIETTEADYKNFGDKPEVRTSEQREFVPESGWHNAFSLREENGEREAYQILTKAYEQHEQNLIKQILATNSLSLTWSNILLPLIHDIVNVTRPDKNHDARDLDIRHYVQIKKLPGGLRNDTKVIEGIVFTKNVAHKGMLQNIENPKVLLLQGAIVYQRTEGRFMSLEPVLMQEYEYLRNVCARIVALQPDIVMVQRNVSRLAQDFLREKGITLVHNVKQSILDRLSSSIQADLVSSLDAHIGRPRLGTCKRFYLKNYSVNKDNSYKTLMFLEGLPMSHLGSTVLLRGASKLELFKIKKILSFILFSSYNWRLEKSFLMDEFAQPPEHKCEFFDESKDISPNLDNNKIPKGQRAEETQRTVQNNKSLTDERVQYSTQTSNEDRNLTVQTVNDFSDPLHSSYKEDDARSVDQQEALSVSELPFSNKFRKALDDTILCISPYVIFPIPFLETEPGKKCLLRKFFPPEIYHSEQFDNNVKHKQKEIECDDQLIEKIEKKPPHPFTTAKFVNSIDTNEIQNLLAHFRACGGRFEKKDTILKCSNKVEEAQMHQDPDEQVDVLDPFNHQRLAVLFCSFSNASQNAPAFCMNPGVVYMDFYGRNDIPLGCFLEKYCFRSSYNCPSNTCGTSMVKHVRRFVHNSGCVSIFLNSFESEFSEENIVTWSWCSKCQSVSPVVPMSTDTWSFSFAKYLELKFHGSRYSRRGNLPCEHSLHHDHYQYFGYKNHVASFRYSPIEIWEISLPPPVIKLNVDIEQQHQILIEEIKELAQKGHEVFTAASEKISSNLTAPDSASPLKDLLTKDKALFRQRIEEVQLKLTSPSVEDKDFNFNEVSKAYWKMNDHMVLVKKCLVEIVDSWNARLVVEADKKRDIDKKKDRYTISESESSNIDNNSIKSESELSQSSTAEQSKNLEILVNGENTDSNNIYLPKEPQKLDTSPLVTSCEAGENRRESDKKSVKTLLSQLLPSSAPTNIIPNPFPVQDHYNLPSGVYATLTVSENDLSSIIAYALNSHELVRLTDDLRQPTNVVEVSSSPGFKRRSQSEKDKGDVGEEKNGGLLGFLRNKDSKTDLLNVSASPGQPDSPGVAQQSTADAVGDNKKLHLDVVFEDITCNFLCRIYYAEKFAALRNSVIPDGEQVYIRSLSRSSSWDARGGKSGSAFTKTTDDRFILKEMSKNEVNLFLESAANYFTYMQKCHATDQPTLLGKIVGIYQIIFKNNTNGHQMRKNVLVMENLFYNRVMSQKFDLKGSIRNRLVIPDNQEGEIVLLDENLLKMTCDSPLYILPHSKAVLAAAIENDTDFLASQSVMDYSLLVGLDSERKELVLGIIDYIRTFTWDKKLETIVKKSGILGGQGKQPTIISPIEYQKRFIEAMHKYFLEVPDHWEGLGENLC